jgi:hypothetical protein
MATPRHSHPSLGLSSSCKVFSHWSTGSDLVLLLPCADNTTESRIPDPDLHTGAGFFIQTLTTMQTPRNYCHCTSMFIVPMLRIPLMTPEITNLKTSTHAQHSVQRDSHVPKSLQGHQGRRQSLDTMPHPIPSTARLLLPQCCPPESGLLCCGLNACAPQNSQVDT